MISKFRIKLFLLWLVGVAALLIFESGLPGAYRYLGIGGFGIVVIAQFYIRCESCASSLVDYFAGPRDDWAKPVGFISATLSGSCPKCGTERI